MLKEKLEVALSGLSISLPVVGKSEDIKRDAMVAGL